MTRSERTIHAYGTDWTYRPDDQEGWSLRAGQEVIRRPLNELFGKALLERAYRAMCEFERAERPGDWRECRWHMTHRGRDLLRMHPGLDSYDVSMFTLFGIEIELLLPPRDAEEDLAWPILRLSRVIQ